MHGSLLELNLFLAGDKFNLFSRATLNQRCFIVLAAGLMRIVFATEQDLCNLLRLVLASWKGCICCSAVFAVDAVVFSLLGFLFVVVAVVVAMFLSVGDSMWQ